MGIVQEYIKHPTIPEVEITVDEHMEGECREPWDIVYLDISFSDIDTPDQLIDIGEWLIQEAKRIKKKYTSKGKVRKSYK